MTTPEILRQAALEIRKGWTQGIRSNAQGEVCTKGAIDRVTGLWAAECFNSEAGKAIDAIADQVCPDETNALLRDYAVVEWNNAKGQTAENVAATMELAAICFEQAREIEETLAAVDPSIQPQESVPRA